METLVEKQAFLNISKETGWGGVYGISGRF